MKYPKILSVTFKAVVDDKKRQLTQRNHTATHLLHQALREILGKHVEQKGSAVHSNYLRFDFSHFAKMTQKELSAVENFVNARIEGKLPLQENRDIPIETALQEGAMALFGEKYGDVVRTIRFGQSIELCGGTHVRNTSEIWQFKILSEGAVAAGIRRIEAITSDALRDYYKAADTTLVDIRRMLNNTQDPIKTVEALQDENNRLKKEIEHLLKDKARNLKDDLLKELKEVNGVNFLAMKNRS